MENCSFDSRSLLKFNCQKNFGHISNGEVAKIYFSTDSSAEEILWLGD